MPRIQHEFHPRVGSQASAPSIDHLVNIWPHPNYTAHFSFSLGSWFTVYHTGQVNEH